MNQQLTTLFSAGLKYLIGALMAALVGWNLLPADGAAAIDSEMAAVITTVAGFLAMIATAVVQHVWAQKFPKAEKQGSGAGSGGSPLPLLLLCGVAAVLLPSCGAEYPMTGGFFYRDPNTGAKAGLKFEDGKGSYYGKVPVYDPETGEMIAYAELEGPLAREVKATK